MINPEDADGGGSSPRSIIRLLHGPATIMVDSYKIFTAESENKGIKQNDPIYMTITGFITTVKPDDRAPIIGVVMNVDGHNVEINTEPGIAIAYNRVESHTGGMIIEGSSYDRSKTIGYNGEEHQSEELKTAKEVASERKDGMRKDEVRTTIDEDLMNALLGD